MTREEARKAAEILDAFANGKELEWCNNMGIWSPVVNPTFNFNDNKYRIKEEKKYRPFKNKEECLNLSEKSRNFTEIFRRYALHICLLCVMMYKISE